MISDSNDGTSIDEVLHFNARRKFKAAVYVVGLVLAMTNPFEEKEHAARMAGKKYHPCRHAACLACRTEMHTMARRTFRAAVYAIMATHRLRDLLRLENDPMYFYQHMYQDPVYDWEDTTIPVVRRHFHREVSLTVDDLFLSDDDYLHRLANLKYGPQKLLHKHKLQGAVMAVLTSVKLCQALGENIHPRNRYRSLQYYTLTLLPWMQGILQSQEDYRQLQFRMAMRRKLRAAIVVLVALQRLHKRVQVSRELRREIHDLKRAKLERKVRKSLSWLGSHMATRHGRHHWSPRHPRSHEERYEEKHEGTFDPTIGTESDGECDGVVKLAWAVTKLAE